MSAIDVFNLIKELVACNFFFIDCLCHAVNTISSQDQVDLLQKIPSYYALWAEYTGESA